MFSLQNLPLFSILILGICIQNVSSDLVRRELTEERLQLLTKDPKDRPSMLPVLLKGPHRTVKFNFVKRNFNYDIPVYTYKKNKKDMILMDLPPIKNAALYEDDNYRATVTLRCEANDPLSGNQYACDSQMMSGFFYFNDKKYVIEPKKRIYKRFFLKYNLDPHKEFTNKHRVYRVSETKSQCDVNHQSDIFKKLPFKIPKYIPTHENINKTKRAKTKYVAELMITFVLQPGTTNVELIDKRIYYTQVIYVANKIFQAMPISDVDFGIVLIGFIIELKETNVLVFPNQVKTNNQIDKTETLNKLSVYRKKVKCDHLSLFTDYQLGTNPNVLGVAPYAGMCQLFSVSLIRNTGYFDEVLTVVHELGHNLMVNHDGEGNPCLPSDGYVMAAIKRTSNDQKFMANHYKFSSCSLANITAYVKSLGSGSCLLTSVSNKRILAQIPSGQLIPIRKQCTFKSKKFTGICNHPDFMKVDRICVSLWCRSGQTCSPIVPAYKTTCGNRKWCVFGLCVADAKAPMADETCLFGDEDEIGYDINLPNGTLYKPKYCHEFIKLKKDFCTDPTLKKKCCDTCFELAHPGNRMTTPKGSITNDPKIPIGGGVTVGNPNSVSVNLNDSFLTLLTTTLCLLVQLDAF